MRTLLNLTNANVKSLVRDRAAVFWTIFFPILFVFLFGAIFGGSSDTRISVGYVDQDGTPASAGIRQAFAGVTLFNLSDGSLDDEKAAMRRGEVSAVIVIPKGLQDALAQARTGAKATAAIAVYGDPSQSQTSQVVLGVVSQVANGVNLAALGGTAIVTVSQETLESTSIGAVAYLVPSILAMALMQLGIFAAIPLVQQREKGILKRLGATPLARWKLVGSNVLLRLMVAIVDAVLIIGIGFAVFNVQVTGNLVAVAGIVLLGSASFLAIGFALASFLKTEEQAQGVVQVVQLPMMFLSGIFFSFELLPGVLQTVARFLPLTYLGDALRQVMVNGTQVAPLGLDVAILAGWLVVCLAIAGRSFRWE